jgi:hypothetical protein
MLLLLLLALLLLALVMLLELEFLEHLLLPREQLGEHGKVLILVVHIQLRGIWACKHDGGNVYDCASVVIGLTSTIAIVNAAVGG